MSTSGSSTPSQPRVQLERLPKHLLEPGGPQHTDTCTWTLPQSVRPGQRTAKLLLVGSKPMQHLSSSQQGVWHLVLLPYGATGNTVGQELYPSMEVHHAKMSRYHSGRLFWSPSSVPGGWLFFPLAGDLLTLSSPAAFISSHYPDIL